MKKYIFLAFLVIIGAGGYYLYNNLEGIVKKLVHKYGSEITGTSVDLQGFKLNLASGEGRIQKFTVANPKGYKTPYLFSTDEVYVRVNIKSLTSGTIVIEEIRVEKPAMAYEMLSVTQNNINDILNNVKKNTAKAASDEKAAEKKDGKSEGSSKKVVINKVAINGINLKAAVATPGIPGVAESKTVDQSVTLPNITIKDIGKGKDGDSVVEAISTVLTKILSEASKAVVDGQLNNIKDKAKEAIDKNLDKALGDVKDKIDTKGLFDKIGL